MVPFSQRQRHQQNSRYQSHQQQPLPQPQQWKSPPSSQTLQANFQPIQHTQQQRFLSPLAREYTPTAAVIGAVGSLTAGPPQPSQPSHRPVPFVGGYTAPQFAGGPPQPSFNTATSNYSSLGYEQRQNAGHFVLPQQPATGWYPSAHSDSDGIGGGPQLARGGPYRHDQGFIPFEPRSRMPPETDGWNGRY